MAAPRKVEELAVKMCAKCGENPRSNAESTNTWCRRCWAEYIRGNRSRELERQRVRGVAEGLDRAAALFDVSPTGYFSGTEVAYRIRMLARD